MKDNTMNTEIKFDRRQVLAALAAVHVAIPMWARAEAFPERPIRFIVPASAGGASDILARLLAIPLAEAWKQPTVVDNRPGASGIIGIDMAAKSPPDGYTILLGNTFMVQAPALYTKLPYDVSKDLQPIVQIGRSQNLFVVPSSSPAKTFKDFVQMVKQEPGRHSFASNGNATSAHMQGVLLNNVAGMDLVHVPFKGSAPQISALVAGQVSGGVVDIASARAHVASGDLRALAVTGEQRARTFSNIPTFGEIGFQGFEALGWFGIFAPSRTPQAIVQKYVAELTRILALPDVVTRIEGLGLTPTSLGPDQLAKSMQTDGELWARMARQGGIRLE